MPNLRTLLLFSFLLSLSLGLFACSKKTSDISDQEILGVVNAYLAENPPAVISPAGTWGAGAKPLPFDIITPKQSLTKSRAAYPTLFALADAALLVITKDQVSTNNAFDSAEKLPGLHVALSEEGAKWYVPATGKLRFADRIARQVLSRQDLDTGDLQITVSLETANIAPWAEKKEIHDAFPGIAEFLADGQEQKTDYLLRYSDTGWQIAKPDELIQ